MEQVASEWERQSMKTAVDLKLSRDYGILERNLLWGKGMTGGSMLDVSINPKSKCGM